MTDLSADPDLFEELELEHAGSILDEGRWAGPDSLVGRRLGRYRVLRRLGGGGMGVVYEGYDSYLRRAVALKLLPVEAAGDPLARAHLLREAQAASALDDHPNVCRIHDLDESDGELFLVMAYYRGETLKLKISAGSLTSAESLDLAVQLARALRHVHEHGWVHRDVKPGNVLVTDQGVVKLLDFGLAEDARGSGNPRGGNRRGTPAYMSPEHRAGRAADVRDDIWSFGVVLSEMLAGRRPPREDGGLPDGTPPALGRILARTLADDPGERYRRAAELLADLERATPLSGRLPGPPASS